MELVTDPSPKLTDAPILFVDATPDEDYPLRILRAHRQHADCMFRVEGLPPERTRVYDLMNEANVKRAEILDRAIARLMGGHQ